MALIRNVCSNVNNLRGMCMNEGEKNITRNQLAICRCMHCMGPVFDNMVESVTDVGVTAPVTDPPPKKTRLLQGTSSERKEYPMCEGLLDYFPDACAEVSQVSFLGNEKHNPGEPMHHARGKSGDHANCIARHLTERGGFDVITINGVERRVRHSAALAWRSLALCQEEIEQEQGLPLPRGAAA